MLLNVGGFWNRAGVYFGLAEEDAVERKDRLSKPEPSIQLTMIAALVGAIVSGVLFGLFSDDLLAGVLFGTGMGVLSSIQAVRERRRTRRDRGAQPTPERSEHP